MKYNWQRWILIGLCGVMAGCSKAPPSGDAVTVASLMEPLRDSIWPARLSQADTIMHSSYDRTGGNNDYGTFLRDSDTPGWKVLVDLKGPGYVSRIWFTGAKDGEPHRFRFYFDGESAPRLEGDIKELFGGNQFPFPAPLAEYNNYCWYSFIPMPYASGLRIECETGSPNADGTPRKLYFQVSENRLPPRTPVESFSLPLNERDAQAVTQTVEVWLNGFTQTGGETTLTTGDLQTGFTLEGPAVLRRLEITPDWEKISAERRNDILRDWMLCIQYDESGVDSVKVPLGDFFGSPWFRLRAQSLFFGMEDDTFFSAFPMPFKQKAVIRIETGRIPPVPVTFRAWLDERPAVATDDIGYFHAGWWRTNPNEIGRPHPVLRAKGRGKFIGCLLSVCALDGSYWVLESDETIRKDDEKTGRWQGTGLEDYFNGGWYYQNVMCGPTHGLPVKEPFRTVQYRIHTMDPSQFETSLDMTFERGPEGRNIATFESVSWYYMDQPQAANTIGLRPDHRLRPHDPQLEPQTLMTALWNYERFGDWQGERDELLDCFRREASSWTPLQRRMLELRLALLEEKVNDAENPLPRFLNDTHEDVRRAANILQQERSGEKTTAVFFANMPARLFIDGHEILQAGNPEQAVFDSIDLPSGRHSVVIATQRQRYPDWVLLALRRGDWFAGSDTTWRYAFAPNGNWFEADYDDSVWPQIGGTGVKGPPEEPYLHVEPDPFIGMQSRAVGIRPGREWPATAGFVVYRTTIDIP